MSSQQAELYFKSADGSDTTTVKRPTTEVSMVKKQDKDTSAIESAEVHNDDLTEAPTNAAVTAAAGTKQDPQQEGETENRIERKSRRGDTPPSEESLEASNRSRRSSEELLKMSDVEKLLLVEVPYRASRAPSLLRVHLAGTVLIRTTSGAKNSFLFDWKKQEPRVEKVTAKVEADCTIEMTEDTLLKIGSGGLNPQIAMLSDKIKVVGKMEHAVYLFNLVASRSENRTRSHR